MRILCLQDGPSLPMGEQLRWLQEHEVLPLVRTLHHAFLSNTIALSHTLFLQLVNSERHTLNHAKSMVPLLLHWVHYRLRRRSALRLLHFRAYARASDSDRRQLELCR